MKLNHEEFMECFFGTECRDPEEYKSYLIIKALYDIERKQIVPLKGPNGELVKLSYPTPLEMFDDNIPGLYPASRRFIGGYVPNPICLRGTAPQEITYMVERHKYLLDNAREKRAA